MSGKPVHRVQRGNLEVAANRTDHNVDGKSNPVLQFYYSRLVSGILSTIL